ncbi:hypothetical protein [Aneurinibacillus aneurinilyticus]|uniref:Phage tail tape measure protein, TP901 family n=1 Tax=Aneurinibacillus aneurinilyticus ATCC 12856 TaxID=649747 RepID=U1XY35_ANEAE|nr:hypothetical protein [Aneurinibacillus aneurinilyticus]ERI04912.1 hypothetical protein HMPREF0083_05879 [Aneurinibacillus aneurinilyticus ATCC 12856]MED0708198.1 hypothetical protein [Aneurinibacillus aneurinilyticus]MED0721449.1 hypothetical protein [Aneurinibacillus aneurinilyticus]MED0734083.1 hypothetical protein [Aneurinibacillus aneurinilyticus]MED0743210.1 hypothetical protein [Aneurinibacillus aneurinilyticus]
MGASVTVSFSGEEKLSPALAEIAAQAKAVGREFSAAASEMEKWKGKDLGIELVVSRTRRDVSDLRSELQQMDEMAVTLSVNVKDEEAKSKIEKIREGLVSLKDTSKEIVSWIGGGTLFEDMVSTGQATARYQALTNKDDKQVKQEVDALTLIDPSKKKSEVIDLLRTAEMSSPGHGKDITEQALKLNMIRPIKDGAAGYQKTLLAMQDSMPNFKETKKFGDSLNYIMGNTKNIKDDTLASIMDSSPKVSKFIDSPEKLAALVKETDILSSADKGQNALKERTLALHKDGGLESVIESAYRAQGEEKAKEKAAEQAKLIAGRMSSGSETERQLATSTMLQIFSGVENEQKRQDIMKEFGTGPDGEKGMPNNFFEATKKISTPEEHKEKLDQTYQKVNENNPWSDFLNAKKTLNDALIELGNTIAKDITPVFKLLAEAAGWIKQKMDNMSTLGSLAVATTGIVGTGLAIGGVKKGAKTVNEAFWGGVGKLATWRPKRKKGKGDTAEPPRRRFTLKGSKNGSSDSIRPLSSMTVSAARVFVNGPVSGGGGSGGISTGDRRGRKPGKGGRVTSARDELTRRKKGNEDHSLSHRTKTVPRDKAKDVIEQNRPKKPSESPKKGFWARTKDALFTGTKGLAKGAGIVGAVASAGAGAYGLYQASKEVGLRQAISTGGGAVVGGVAGGAIGGAIGSLAGPFGTAAGAAVGNYIGDKIGSLADSSGLTAKAVDAVVSLKDKAANFFGLSKKEETAKKEVQNAVASKPSPPPAPVVPISPQVKESFKGTFSSLKTSMKQKGIEMDFSLFQKTGKGVQNTFNKMKSSVMGWWKGSNTKKAQGDIHAVGSATQKTNAQAKQLGTIAARSTQEISAGAKKAGQSFAGVSTSAKGAANQTKQHLESLKNISSQGSSWGSNLISMLASGIRSQFPLLSAVVSGAAGIFKKYLGFSSPTKEGPASKSDRWAGNFMSMFAGGLDAGPVRQKMNLIAGAMNRPLRGRAAIDVLPRSQATEGGRIPVAARMMKQATRSTGGVIIQNMTMDFGEMAKQVKDFPAFAKMMTSPEGRALMRRVLGEELHKAIENGG